MVETIEKPFDSERYSKAGQLFEATDGSYYIVANDGVRVLILTPHKDKQGIYKVVDKFDNAEMEMAFHSDEDFEFSEEVEVTPQIELMFWKGVYAFDDSFGPIDFDPDERMLMFEIADGYLQLFYEPTDDPIEDPTKPKPISEWEAGEFDAEAREKARQAVQSFKRIKDAHEVSNQL